MYANTITDYDIQALADDELSGEEGRRIFLCVQENDLFRERYEELLAQKRMLEAWWLASQGAPQKPGKKHRMKNLLS